LRGWDAKEGNILPEEISLNTGALSRHSETKADTAGPISHDAAILAALKREDKARAARTDLQKFIEFCMPDPEHYDDIDKSLYECQPVHELIISLFTKTINREFLRAALSVPSQHGKTTVVAEYGIAWYAANNPTHKILYGSYSEPRAKIVGGDVRDIMQSTRFKEVFPEFEIKKGSKSKDVIGFGDGGSVMFLGRNSGGSGNPCNLFIIDDPFKNHAEAKSPAVREEVWDWYCGVVEARCPAHTPIFIVHTRWNDDDLIGRLCDEDHTDYDPEDNDEFEYLNLPGVIYENQEQLLDILNIKLCTHDEARDLKLEKRAGTLWPQKIVKGEMVDHWPLWLYMNMKRKNPTSFTAMVMGNPVPPEGDFFKKKMIKPYKRRDLPENLRIYGASDHAVGTKTRNDHTVMGCAGVDEDGELWILPDLVWEKIETDVQVDKMAAMIKKHKPINWWAEGDHIKKSIGPFLKKRLKKLKIFTTVIKELSKSGDKIQKAQSIRAMAAMGMLHLPEFAWWYEPALKQLLRFDGSEGRPDDVVDFLANLGRGLNNMQDAPAPAKPKTPLPKSGTIAWVKSAYRQEKLMKKREKAMAGW